MAPFSYFTLHEGNYPNAQTIPFGTGFLDWQLDRDFAA